MLTTTPPPVPDTDLIYSHITVFPNGAMRILSAIIHLLGSSVLGYCIACRISTVRIKSVADLKSLTWPRVCVMLVLVLSWLFVFGAGILIHGVGMASSFRACSAGIHLCIWLYAISKLLIYDFLIEKVRVVWGIVSQPRLTSPLYIVCLLIMLPFFGVPILMTVGRIAYFRSDMTCVIGLKAFSSLSLLIYDLCINVFMNAMFLWPLLRYKLINPRLRAVARRTLFAAFAALATSIVNIATLTAMKGQLGWVCLGSCGTDVTLNAIVLFWVTSPMADSNTPSNTARVQVQSSASQTEGKPGDGTPQSPVTATSPIVFAPPAVYLSRGSVTSPTMSNKAFEAMRQQDFSDEHNHRRILPLVELPKLTASSSEGVSISPSDEERGPSNHSRPDSPGRMQSFRRLLGLPPKQNEKDVEVHVSVITQHEIELGNLGNDTRHEDSESIDRAKRKSQWYK